MTIQHRVSCLNQPRSHQHMVCPIPYSLWGRAIDGLHWKKLEHISQYLRLSNPSTCRIIIPEHQRSPHSHRFIYRSHRGQHVGRRSDTGLSSPPPLPLKSLLELLNFEVRQWKSGNQPCMTIRPPFSLPNTLFCTRQLLRQLLRDRPLLKVKNNITRLLSSICKKLLNQYIFLRYCESQLLYCDLFFTAGNSLYMVSQGRLKTPIYRSCLTYWNFTLQSSIFTFSLLWTFTCKCTKSVFSFILRLGTLYLADWLQSL